jgi:transcription antitermination protein NusB
MITRREIRAKVMQAVYASIYSETPAAQMYDLHLKEVEPDVLELEKTKGVAGDMRLMKVLFNETLKNQEKYDAILLEKATNWDLNRIARIDKVLMQMAICEVFNFEEIPVKVTLNEYIEIAKEYSTPESGKFINGMLDRLFVDFEEKGLIKKNQQGLQNEKQKR